MNQNATVTSKMQLTLPINIARKVGVKSGEKVHVFEENGRIVITPVKQLLKELAGSLSMPVRWKDKDTEFIIQQAKQEHFGNKKT